LQATIFPRRRGRRLHTTTASRWCDTQSHHGGKRHYYIILTSILIISSSSPLLLLLLLLLYYLHYYDGSAPTLISCSVVDVYIAGQLNCNSKKSVAGGLHGFPLFCRRGPNHFYSREYFAPSHSAVAASPARCSRVWNAVLCTCRFLVFVWIYMMLLQYYVFNVSWNIYYLLLLFLLLLYSGQNGGELKQKLLVFSSSAQRCILLLIIYSRSDVFRFV